MDAPFRTLTELLDRNRPVLVQTHDFPDHDAVGAAYALCELLQRRDFSCSMTYGGLIQSISLSEMIAKLFIKLEDFGEACATSGFQTIVVDGSPAGGTIKKVAGSLVGVIDHHPARRPIRCPFIDVRPETGSCSSIIWTYWKEAGEVPDRTAATALIAGIQLDTDFLSRRVSRTDLDALSDLFFLGNNTLAREVVRTALRLDQLPDIGKAFSSTAVEGAVIVAELEGDYSSELLSVLADFLLRLQEITFAVVIETGGNECRLSARTRDAELDAGLVLSKALAGIGSGGGHPHMAGGIVRKEKYSGKADFLRRIADGITRSRNETDCQAD
jgi:nanoRNase/pAp phosphatase (c-di-AMP/oligoRNAs hydrolase)